MLWYVGKKDPELVVTFGMNFVAPAADTWKIREGGVTNRKKQQPIAPRAGESNFRLSLPPQFA